MIRRSSRTRRRRERAAFRVDLYWVNPPPEPSASLLKWVARAHAGWRPSQRIWAEGYHTSAEFYQVYIWEYLNVLGPLLRRACVPDSAGRDYNHHRHYDRRALSTRMISSD